MTNLLSSYTRTVRKMLKEYNEELYDLFVDQNIDEVWLYHDNWNGGIDYYKIVVRVPVEFYAILRKRGIVEETENAIAGFYKDAMRGDGESIQLKDVFLKPSDDEIRTLGDNIDDSMWKPGFFRLFISHLSDNKIPASNLKQCLAKYGIDCFVAHEDIIPSKEWEIEIEKALFTMDALCAIVVPDFIKSQWCDQEVGIALGRRKLVISIDRGHVPYGFFGKYQALKSKDKSANEIACDVWTAIHTNEITKTTYFKKIVELILNAKNNNDAMHFISILGNCTEINKQHIENLHENWSSNSILFSSDVISSINPLFMKYGLTPITDISQLILPTDQEELPF